MAGYFLGAPISTSDRSAFETNLVARFSASGTLSEESVRYMCQVNDRIINKARALLTFNSIIAALSAVVVPYAPAEFLSIELSRESITFAFRGITGTSIVSCLMIFEIFLAKWGPPARHASTRDDLLAYCKFCYQRSIVLNIAIYLSGLSAITFVIAVFFLLQ